MWGYFSNTNKYFKWVLGKKSGEIRSILDDFYSIGHSSGLDMLIGVKKYLMYC